MDVTFNFGIYFFAALLKSDPQWHQSGTAVYYALRFEQLATPFSSLLLAAPPIVLQWLTHAVWFTEALVPFFFFAPFFKGQLRLFAIGILSTFHIGLGVFLNLGTFVFIPIIALSALLPTSFWNLFSRLLQKYFPVNLTIYFDDDCGFCRRSVAVISYCLLLYGVRNVPAQEVPKMYEKMQHHNSWIVSDSVGKLYFKEQALARLLRSSPIFFIISPLFFWKPIIKLGDRVYETIVKHRFIACSVPKPRRKLFEYLDIILKTVVTCIVMVFLVSITFWNITTLPQQFTMPTSLANLCRSLYLNQSWDMFAPYPSLEDGWYVMPAILSNGKTIDLFTQKQVTWEKPPLTASMYKDERWTKYMMNLSYKSNRSYRPYFATYLCNLWNKSHTEEDQVKNVAIYFMLKEIPQPFSTSATQARPIALGHYACL